LPRHLELKAMSSAQVRRLVWVGGALALAAALFMHYLDRAALLPPPTSPPAAAASTAVTATVTATSAVDAQRRLWSPGALYLYTLVSSQSVTVRSGQAGAQPGRPMRFRLEGAWQVGVCSAGAAGVEARVAFSPADFSVDMGDEQPLAPEIRRELREGLGAPFFITLDRAGAVRTIHFEHSVGALVQGLLRSVVAATQVVLPASASASWEVAEEDSSGLYAASYRVLADPFRVEKRKLRYTHLAMDEGVNPVAASTKVEVNAHTNLILDREGLWLELLQGEETVTVATGPDMPVSTAHTKVDLRLAERGADPSLIGALAARRSSLFSLPMATAQLASDQDPRDLYRRTLAGRTLSDFITLLRALPEEKNARGDALADALNGLRALFMLEPTAAAKVPPLLRTDLAPVAVSTLLGALGNAATPEALHTLSLIMGDPRFPFEVRAEATVDMGLAETPTEEGIASLWRLCRGSETALHQAAVLSLGSAAMNLQKVDARAAGALVDEMNKALAAARGEEAQSLWLGALGNTRHPRALPSIEAFVGVPSAKLRASAIQSLRFMPAPRADDRLSERMLKDDSPEVRRVAVFAAGFRPLAPLLPAIEGALRAEPLSALRQALVELLEAHAGTSSEARRLLTWSSREDPDESVRGKAAAALTRRP
jgi:hypothetical protein